MQLGDRCTAVRQLTTGAQNMSTCCACSWFELDQDEVVDLKGKLLAAAGASKVTGQEAKHPLKAGSYVSTVANLTDASWPTALTKTGSACHYRIA